MPEVLIRGGKIVDGTGRVAFTGDVAIAHGRIAAVGKDLGSAKRKVCLLFRWYSPKFIAGRLIKEGRIRRGFIGVGGQHALLPRRLVHVLQLPLPATAYLFVLTIVTEER